LKFPSFAAGESGGSITPRKFSRGAAEVAFFCFLYAPVDFIPALKFPSFAAGESGGLITPRKFSRDAAEVAFFLFSLCAGRFHPGVEISVFRRRRKRRGDHAEEI